MTDHPVTPDPAAPKRLPNGAAAAALLATGIGTSVFALLVILSEASAAVANALNLYNPAGPLSGKTTIAVLFWLVVWSALDRRWRAVDVEFDKVWKWSLVLYAFAFIGTFPPVFTLFGH